MPIQAKEEEVNYHDVMGNHETKQKVIEQKLLQKRNRRKKANLHIPLSSVNLMRQQVLHSDAQYLQPRAIRHGNLITSANTCITKYILIFRT